MIKPGSKVRAAVDGMPTARVGTISTITEYAVGEEIDRIALVYWDGLGYASAINVLNLVEAE